MDDLTLDFSEFGSDPLLGGEETDPLDPFPPQDDGPCAGPRGSFEPGPGPL